MKHLAFPCNPFPRYPLFYSYCPVNTAIRKKLKNTPFFLQNKDALSLSLYLSLSLSIYQDAGGEDNVTGGQKPHLLFLHPYHQSVVDSISVRWHQDPKLVHLSVPPPHTTATHSTFHSGIHYDLYAPSTFSGG